MQRAMGHSGTAPEEYLDTWRAVHKDLMWVPAKGRYDRVASATPAERVESTKVWLVVLVLTCWALHVGWRVITLPCLLPHCT